MRVAFSCYGGKGMVVNYYPKPIYKTIIEPLAGGASYSLKYCKHDIILCDVNRMLCEIWWFLQSKNAIDYIKHIPLNIDAGENIKNIKGYDKFPTGLQQLLVSACNVGQYGCGVRKLKQPSTLTRISRYHWERNTTRKILFWNNKIRHWKIFNVSYNKIRNQTATWFVDPPYNNIAGKKYYYNKINYDDLRKFCLSRKGQIIVCENEGSNWMDFELLNCKSNAAVGNKKTGKEVYYHIINN